MVIVFHKHKSPNFFDHLIAVNDKHFHIHIGQMNSPRDNNKFMVVGPV